MIMIFESFQLNTKRHLKLHFLTSVALDTKDCGEDLGVFCHNDHKLSDDDNL